MGQSKVFAIGDIHGCALELRQLIDKLPLDDSSELVFLGDYVDRGPNTKDVIDTILDLKKKYKVTALLGNHEAMMLEFFRDPSSSLAGFFILNGGSATLASYIKDGEMDYEIPKEHLKFFQELPLFYETETHFFVHAGVPDLPLNEIEPEYHSNDLLWIRRPFLESVYNWGKVVVHGHSPVGKPEIYNNRINLDTGCVFSGHLSAMEVHSKKLYQVKAREEIPKNFLPAAAEYSRVARRFIGTIPIFVETPEGVKQFQTVNYNEFGLLIVEQTESERQFEVGQVLKGKIGDPNREQITFVGQVVRHQKRGDEIAYGIKMIEPLSKI